MLKERDLRIIRHIEEYGFITIKQAYKIFFTDRRCGYDLARRRLAKLVEQGHMNGYMDYLSTNPEKIFYIKDKYKMPSKHTLLIMDSYAEMVNLGANVLHFKREQRWDKTDRRSDGYAIFIMGDYLYEIFVEVIYHIGTDQKSRKIDMSKKYVDIIESEESSDVLKKVIGKDYIPNSNKVILIVSSSIDDDEIEIEDEKVVNVDYRFNGIGNILT